MLGQSFSNYYYFNLHHCDFSLKKIARKHLRYVCLNMKPFHFLLSENNVTYPRTIHKNNEEEYYSSRHSISLTDTFLRNLQYHSTCLIGQQSLGKPLTNHQSIASVSCYLSHGANQSMFCFPNQFLVVQLVNPTLRDQIRVLHTQIFPRSIPGNQRIVYSTKIGVESNHEGNLQKIII